MACNSFFLTSEIKGVSPDKTKKGMRNREERMMDKANLLSGQVPRVGYLMLSL